MGAGRVLVLLAAVAGLLAACSGPDGDELYRKDATLACLDERYDFELLTDELEMDILAAGASNGAFQAEVGFDGDRERTTTVVVKFGRSRSQAKRLVARDRFILAGTYGDHVENAVYRKSNAVLFWHSRPTDEEREAVEGCLRA